MVIFRRIKMSAPFFTHMAQRYRSPQNFKNQSKTYGKRPHPGFQWRPHAQFGPVNNSTTESNDEHWCETCDRGFPTADLLEQHKQQHQKCNIDGCQFVAHPKVVTKHIQMQHASGLYKKIAKLNDPEEIRKWREERKKKYPTRTNLEKKEAEYKEKVERGEKMGLKPSRNRVDKSTDQSAPRNRFSKRNDYHSGNKSHRNPPPKKLKPAPQIPSMVEKNKLKPFTGILSICMDDDTEEDVCNLSNSNNRLIEEDEYNEEQIEQPIAKPIQEQPVLCGALSSLLCDYGSSDENDVEVHQPQKIDKLDRKWESTNNINMNNNTEISKSNNKEVKDVTNNNLDLNQTNKSQDDSDNDSGPDEVKNIKIDNKEPPCTSSTSLLQTSKTKCNKNRNNIMQRNRHKQNVPSTLLQKLLYKEVKQERNIILQCIRHLVKKKIVTNLK